MQTFISFCQGKGEKGLQKHFIFCTKLRKFVQKILKRLDVFRQASACPYERSLGIKKKAAVTLHVAGSNNSFFQILYIACVLC